MPPLVEARHYDNRQAVGRMSDLIGARGQAEAQRQLTRGQAAAQGWATTGKVIGDTIGDLVKIKLDEPKRRRAEAQAEREERKARREDNLEGVQMKIAGLPEREQIAVLKQEGYLDEARKLQTLMTQAGREEVRSKLDNLDLAGKQLEQAATQINRISGMPDRLEAWPQHRPRIVEMVGPDIGSTIPENFSTVEEMDAWLKSAPEMAMDAVQVATVRATAARDAINVDADKRDSLGDFANISARVLAAGSIDTPEELAEHYADMEKAGAPVEQLKGIFGETYSPEVNKTAEKFLNADKSKGDFNFRDYVESWESSHPGETLSTPQIERLRARWAAAGRDPDGSGSSGGKLTKVQMAVQFARRRAELARIDQRLLDNPTGFTEEMAQREREDIELEHALVMGLPPPKGDELTPGTPITGPGGVGFGGGGVKAATGGGGMPPARTPGAGPVGGGNAAAGTMGQLVEGEPPNTGAQQPTPDVFKGPPVDVYGHPVPGGAPAPPVLAGPNAGAPPPSAPFGGGPPPQAPPMPPTRPASGIPPEVAPTPPGVPPANAPPPMQGPRAAPPKAPPTLPKGSIVVKLPNGSTRVFTSEAQLKAFEDKFGIKFSRNK